MPDTRGTVGFGGGFAQTSGAMTQRRQVEVAQEKLMFEQRKQLRDKSDASVADSLSKLELSAKGQSAAFFSELEETGRQKIKDIHTRTAQTLWGSTQQMLEAGKQQGLYNDAEIANIKEQFRIAATLNNPVAEQKLEEQVKTEGAIATAEGKQPLELEQIRVRGEEARKTRAVPTSSTETLITQGGAASQPPDQEPFEGIGTSIMEDIRQSSGAFAAASKAVSRTVGQAVEGTNPRLDAEQRVRNFNQDFKNTLTRNPRYPVKELEAISNNLLPDPTAIITDPEAEARKIPLLKQHLENLNEVDARTLQGNLSKKGRNDTIDRMASRQSGIDLIGDVPDISADIEAELDALQEKVLSDTATEDELSRFIELSK